MSKRDDINSLYIRTNVLDKACKVMFYGNVSASLLSTVVPDQFHELLQIIQIITVITYVILKCVDDGVFWYAAEMERRKNNIQTAFDLRLSEMETDGYYNNDMKPSVLKYATNTFESNYFSKFLAGKMLWTSALKALLAVVVLIVSCCLISTGDILLIIAEAIFSAYVVEETIMLALYKLRLDQLYNEAYAEFVTLGVKTRKQKIWLLSYAVEYEAVKAHFKVRLDSKLFTKYNDELSRSWDNLKKKIIV